MAGASAFLHAIACRCACLVIGSAAGGCAVVDSMLEPAVSGYAPVVASRQALQQLAAQPLPVVPLVYERNNPGLRTYVFAFDGTRNDRNRQWEGTEQPTVVAELVRKIGQRIDLESGPEVALESLPDEARHRVRLAGRPSCQEAVPAAGSNPLRVCYLPGAGMQNAGFVDRLDAVFGFSTASVAEAALEDLSAWVALNPPPPGGELRVVAIGFSRGGVSARRFLNRVHQAFGTGDEATARRSTLWSYALLFDTVPTFQRDEGLSLPPDLEWAVHFLARDERRTAFTPVMDVDLSEPRAPYAQQRRIHTVILPGAHTDIGDGYLISAGHLVGLQAQQVLAEMGLAAPVDAELAMTGALLTDSRGWWDRLKGSPEPYTCAADASKPARAAKVVYSRMDEEATARPRARQAWRAASAPVFSLPYAVGRSLWNVTVTVDPGLAGARVPDGSRLGVTLKAGADDALIIKLRDEAGGQLDVRLSPEAGRRLAPHGGTVELAFAPAFERQAKAAQPTVASRLSVYLEGCLLR